MTADAGSGEDRLRFIEHKGRTIYLVDFSNCSAKEMLLLLEEVTAVVTQHAHGSMLTLADFTGAEMDRAVVTRMKEVLTLDRPFVKRSAWVGAESLPHIFQEHIKSFSQRDFPTFPTREEAMEWLVAE
jgi:hypothetical protein